MTDRARDKERRLKRFHVEPEVLADLVRELRGPYQLPFDLSVSGVEWRPELRAFEFIATSRAWDVVPDGDQPPLHEPPVFKIEPEHATPALTAAQLHELVEAVAHNVAASLIEEVVTAWQFRVNLPRKKLPSSALQALKENGA